jgi:hypothetical protein
MSRTHSTINSRRDGELLGLNAHNNGRSCEQHECCGKALKRDDVIRFKLTVGDDISGMLLETIKAVIIKKDGTELCTFGFLGREVAALPSQKIKYIDKFGQVLELYDTHENMRYKRKRNAGMASFRLMEDIQADQE